MTLESHFARTDPTVRAIYQRLDVDALRIARTASIRDAVTCIDRTAVGIALVTDEDRRLLATITDGDVRRWFGLGQVMRRLHRELAADGLDFAAVLSSGPKLAHFNETERWQALLDSTR